MRDYGDQVPEQELDYLRRKVSAAGELKTAVKRFLDGCDGCLKGRCKPHKELRRRMEDYLNGVSKRV